MTILTIIVILLCIFIIYVLNEYAKQQKKIKQLQKDLDWEKKPSFSITIRARLNDNNELSYLLSDDYVYDYKRGYWDSIVCKDLLITENKETEFKSIKEARQYISDRLAMVLTTVKNTVDIETVQLQ